MILKSLRADTKFAVTIAHEIGHWLFHKVYFARHMSDGQQVARVSDMDTSIEGREGFTLQTDHDWMEHQANYFSGAILMPESAFRKAVENPAIQRFLFITHARSDVDVRDRKLAKQLAHVFQVSEEAARLRMKELNISMGPGMSSAEFGQARKEFLKEQAAKKRGRRRNKGMSRPI